MKREKYRLISWYAVPGTITEYGKFELHYPWWVSGERCSDGAHTIVAAIPVELEEEAQAVVMESYDHKPAYEVELEIRFNDLKTGSPFCERFPRRAWMKWPAAIKASRRKP